MKLENKKTFFSLLSVLIIFCFFIVNCHKKESVADSPPLMSIVLEPGPIGQDERIGHVDVTITLECEDALSGEALFRMPLIYANIESVAKTMQNFEASDAEGAVQMEVEDDPGGSTIVFRRWIPTRLVKGDLIVQYRAPIEEDIPDRTGPPFGMSTEGGGFSGAGNVFIMTPVESKKYQLEILWSLDELGPDAEGCSSFGDGDVKIAEAGAADKLMSVFFMAGPVNHYPEEPTQDGFSSVWLSSPPFDPVPLMEWTEKLHSYFRGFFKTEVKKPYRVFLRYNPINPGGGVGMYNSFVATFDQNSKGDFHLLLSHEMFHTFAPKLEEEEDDQKMLSSNQWFDEGLAVFYQSQLPFRAGMVESEVFMKSLNRTAARYYTNPLNNTPNEQIALKFWDDTRVRVLPYDRGSMYMAVLDSQIRKASEGKRSLDDILLALLERQRKELTNTTETWVDLLTKELGPSAKEGYEAMLEGQLILPESDAFGPCFKRTTVKLRRFELGFDPSVMNEQPLIIHGLIPGSAAEKAGLHNGDEIVHPVGLDGVQGSQTRTITLKIRRDGEVFSVTYLPRGEEVDAYQWERVPGVPDKECYPWD